MTRRNGMICCRVCGCTETDACANSCSWVEKDLCSTCAKVISALYEWWSYARRPVVEGLMREFRAAKKRMPATEGERV